MAVRFVKSGIHWNYEDVRRDLRIYRLEDPRFEGCHISVYLSGDYHAKDKKGNYYGYINKRFIRKKVSRLAKMFNLFEKNVLETLDGTLTERIKKVKHRNAERRTKLAGIDWKMHNGKFGILKKSSKQNVNVMAPRESERSRCKRPSILKKPGHTNFKNFKTIPKNRVRITKRMEIVQEKEMSN